MLITFSGLDGSGKTTQISLFTEFLKKNNYKFKQITMYDNISTSALIRKFFRRRPKNPSSSNNTTKSTYRNDKNRKDPQIVLLRKITYIFDLYILIIKRSYYEKIRGYILIMDRCLYDSLANLFNANSTIYTKLMLKIIPTPDLAILLDAKPEVAYKRKPEYAPEFYRERRDAYISIFKNVPTSAIIDSSQGRIDFIQRKIRESFANVQKHRINGADRYSEHMSFITRTLFNKGENKTTILKKLNFKDMLTVLSKNRITVRWLQKMRYAFSEAQQNKIDSILHGEEIRLKKALEIIDKVTKEFEKRDLSIMVIKTLDNYPDLGHDIDLYTDAPIEEINNILIGNFKAKLERPTISERLSQKRNYRISGYPTLEIHCSRLGQLGEESLLAKDLILNREKAKIDGKTAYVPKPEYRVLLCVLQRIYRHFNIRICDLYNTIQLINSHSIDWQHLKAISVKYGIWEGVLRYLSYIQKIAQGYDIRLNIAKQLETKDWPSAIADKNMHFRFPLFTTGLNTYSKKIASELKRLNLYSLSRLSLIAPLSFTHYFSVKFFGKSRIW